MHAGGIVITIVTCSDLHSFRFLEECEDKIGCATNLQVQEVGNPTHIFPVGQRKRCQVNTTHIFPSKWTKWMKSLKREAKGM
jgi:hypothetical protein